MFIVSATITAIVTTKLAVTLIAPCRLATHRLSELKRIQLVWLISTCGEEAVAEIGITF